jgi:hypothetical protein
VKSFEKKELEAFTIHYLESYLSSHSAKEPYLALHCFFAHIRLVNELPQKRKNDLWTFAHILLLKQLIQNPDPQSFKEILFRMLEERGDPGHYLYDLLTQLREDAPQNLQARSCLIAILAEHLESVIKTQDKSTIYFKLIDEVIYECVGLEGFQFLNHPYLKSAKGILSALKTQHWLEETDPKLTEYQIAVESIIPGEVTEPLKRAFSKLAQFATNRSLVTLCGLLKTSVLMVILKSREDLRALYKILLVYLKNYSCAEPFQPICETMAFVFKECFFTQTDSSPQWLKTTLQIQKQYFLPFFSIFKTVGHLQYLDQRKPVLIALIKILLKARQIQLIDEEEFFNEMKNLGKDKNERNAALCQTIYELIQTEDIEKVTNALVLLAKLSPSEVDSQNQLGIGIEFFDKINHDCQSYIKK